MATTNVKVTKQDVLAAVKVIVSDENVVASIEVNGKEVTVQDILDYVETTTDQLTTKAAKAKERAAAVKAEGDELRAAVEAELTNEFQTIDTITAKVAADDDSITKSKVTARLTSLVRAGKAHKTQVKSESGRTLTAYAVGPEPDAE